ncbi:MAG: ABC transporter permease subunit [Aliivibrio sp.]|uniref:ABC transporter permease n=1 Tax=Aliivibrio sp. TaxID=1872443 RepID=UPI001A51BF77|nr:ABC transporter permease subunit [Aliivibrio sp.]
MFIYTIRRLNLFVITLTILTLIGYGLVRLEPTTTWAHMDFWSGWVQYLKQVLDGELGVNHQGLSVIDEVAKVFPATLELCFFASILSLLIGIPLGTIAGMKRGSPIDTLISSTALIGYSMPLFWIALLSIMFFSLRLGWLPVSGQYSMLYEIETKTGVTIIDTLLLKDPNQGYILIDVVNHLVLPTVVLALAPMTEVIREMRVSVANVITKNYIKAAQTRGLSKYEIIVRHVIRNALPPIIPKLGIQMSGMLTAAMMTESIFNWPGIGRWLLNAIANQDYVSIQAGVLAVASFVLIANIITDLIGAFANPLVRKQWNAI